MTGLAPLTPALAAPALAASVGCAFAEITFEPGWPRSGVPTLARGSVQADEGGSDEHDDADVGCVPAPPQGRASPAPSWSASANSL